MSAYIIAQPAVSDAQRYETYKALAKVAVDKYGGEYIARGGVTECLEGDWNPPRLVIIRFDSMDRARAWYASAEYQAAVVARRGAAEMRMLVVEGL